MKDFMEVKIHVQNNKTVYIYVRFQRVVTLCEISCKSLHSKQDFGE